MSQLAENTVSVVAGIGTPDDIWMQLAMLEHPDAAVIYSNDASSILNAIQKYGNIPVVLIGDQDDITPEINYSCIVTIKSQSASELDYAINSAVKKYRSNKTTEKLNTNKKQIPWQILVLDDEPSINKVLKIILESAGHSVTVVTNGKDAVSTWKTAFADKKPFQLAILDLTIPDGIGGKEVVKEIQIIDPNALAIASSGYLSDDIMENHKNYGFARCMAKPYRATDVLKLINELQITHNTTIRYKN